MTIRTYNARTLASEVSIEDLMMQARKIKHDVIGLTATRRHRLLNTVFDTGEELFLGTCDSRGVGGVGVFVNTTLAMNVDSFEQLTTRIGRLRLKLWINTSLDSLRRLRSTSSYDEEEVEDFYMDLEKFYKEDYTFYKVIVGDFNAKVGPFTSLAGFWEDSAVDNINEEYDRLVQHLHDSARKVEGCKTTRKRLSLEILELIRQRGAAKVAGNHRLTSELTKKCREAIKENLKERRAAVLVGAAQAGMSIRKARRLRQL